MKGSGTEASGYHSASLQNPNRCPRFFFSGCLCDGNSQAIPALGASGHMLLVNERVCLAYGLGWGQLAVGVGGGRLPPRVIWGLSK